MPQSLRCITLVSVVALAVLGLAPSLTPDAAAQIIIIDRPPPPPPPMPPMPPAPPRPPLPRPRPPLRNMQLEVKRLGVDVAITDGVARTQIDQTFYNPLDTIVEGTFVYPLDDDVALSQFSMNINGQEVEGKLLEVEEARRTYERIVASMRDPALLEYAGRKMFQARVFPINPHSEVRVKLSYTQMLGMDAGLVRYRYPLNVARQIPKPVETLGLLVKIESKVPIKSVFSPTHPVAVSRLSDNKASASFEGANVSPERDFELLYALSDKEFGLTALTFRAEGQDGFFLARISPPATLSAGDVVAKDIAFVIDTSGSMSGEKIDQARRALKFCLQNLHAADRFNVIPFSHEPLKFADALTPAAPETIEKAVKFAEELKAIGGTNINDALLLALQMAPTESGEASRPYYIVFLTDGQPTISVAVPDEILENVKKANAQRVRMFVFGVGTDVNTRFLDLLAEQNRGTRDYVEPGQDLELVLSSFYRKVADPVLSDLELAFGDLRIYDTYPPKLGDLFSGNELVVVGRYGGAGPKAVTLTGQRRGRQEKFIYETTFPEKDTKNDFLPRLWATRKVGYLLDQMRLHGSNQELKDTIVQLATQYGIITPYTAYLVTEPQRMARAGGQADGFRIRPDSWEAEAVGDWTLSVADADADAGRRPQLLELGYIDSDVGGAAVARSESAAQMKRAEANSPVAFGGAGGGRNDEAADRGDDKKLRLIETVGTRTFYRVKGKWIDSAFDGKAETQKVTAFSPEYFELVRAHFGLGPCFALGERVIVVVGDKVYETVPPLEPEASEPQP